MIPGAPCSVRAEPRYVQEQVQSWSTGQNLPMPVWNLDGVGWYDTPAPPRRHQHWAQTIGYVDGLEFRRCPCQATWTVIHGWQQMHEARTAATFWQRGWRARA